MKKHRLPAAVLALAALGFTLGTCEFVIVGILPDIAAGLNVSLAAVGRASMLRTFTPRNRSISPISRRKRSIRPVRAVSSGVPTA